MTGALVTLIYFPNKESSKPADRETPPSEGEIIHEEKVDLHLPYGPFIVTVPDIQSLGRRQ